MNLQKTLPILIVFISFLNGVTIIGEGIGESQQDAKKNSLADLSNKISVNVKSDFKTFTRIFGDDYKKNREKLVQISSSLPIISVDYKHSQEGSHIKISSKLSSENALDAYIIELNRLKQEIQKAYSNLKLIDLDITRYKVLEQLLNDIDSFNKHKIVAVILNGKNLPTLDIGSSEIKIELLKLGEKVNTIELAAKILTDKIDKNKVYISAPTTSISSQITQFAKILKDQMSIYINHTKYSKDAKYFLRGSYDILDNKIYVSMKLYDESNNIIKANSVTLNQKAFAGTNYKPDSKSFDEAINSEYVKSDNLDISIGFKGYNRAWGIDLVEDDMVSIVAKTNKPICYFLLGHTLHKNNKFSYLLPIGSDNSPFVNYITGDDVNKLITLIDDIPISEPFGSENLQIFASTFDKKCSLNVPNCKENEDGYCIIDDNPSGVVIKTRGLNLKRKKSKIEKAHNSVSWTSFKKTSN